MEIDRAIRGSEELKGWIEVGEEQEAEALLSGELLDLRGYNYSCEITFAVPVTVFGWTGYPRTMGMPGVFRMDYT